MLKRRYQCLSKAEKKRAVLVSKLSLRNPPRSPRLPDTRVSTKDFHSYGKKQWGIKVRRALSYFSLFLGCLCNITRRMLSTPLLAWKATIVVFYRRKTIVFIVLIMQISITLSFIFTTVYFFCSYLLVYDIFYHEICRYLLDYTTMTSSWKYIFPVMFSGTFLQQVYQLILWELYINSSL